jgi:exonuclease VII small subunit
MSATEHNEVVLSRLRAAIAALSSGELDLDAVQAQLQQALGLLESDGTGVADLVRGAEADVEEIRFTRLLEEQLPAVIFRLDALLDSLPRT